MFWYWFNREEHSVKMNRLYRLVGISKQGFHQKLDREIKRKEEQMQLLPIIGQIREDHPRLSCRGMYFMLNPRHMGRDRFEAFCFTHGYKIETQRNKYRTTDSLGVIRFPNLLFQTEELTGTNQVWVSDITYFQIQNDVYYLTFITDLYSRKIVGYTASRTLRTEDTTLKALKAALAERRIEKGSGLIIHSDGGGQYYCKNFLKLTQPYGIRNSMGKSAYDNPHAERVNGTIKNDYLSCYQPQNYQELQRLLIKAVDLYNMKRPHSSLTRLSPEAFETCINKGLLTRIWVINKRKKVTKKEKVNITIKTL
jgi:putative transposase